MPPPGPGGHATRTAGWEAGEARPHPRPLAHRVGEGGGPRCWAPPREKGGWVAPRGPSPTAVGEGGGAEGLGAGGAGDAVPGAADGVLDLVPGGAGVAALVVGAQVGLDVGPGAAAVAGVVGHLPAVAVAGLVVVPAGAGGAVALLPVAAVARGVLVPGARGPAGLDGGDAGGGVAGREAGGGGGVGGGVAMLDVVGAVLVQDLLGLVVADAGADGDEGAAARDLLLVPVGLLAGDAHPDQG